MKGRRKETRLNHYFRHIGDNKNLQYGREKEEEARSKYIEVTGFPAITTGLVICQEQPWLACSPDGIIFTDFEPILLEIKCPKTCENGKIVTDYLSDGKLKRSHQYYTQIQLQMYICNIKKCDFFVYSSADYFLERVDLDMPFL